MKVKAVNHKIAIIGAGWYGTHLALELKSKEPSYQVTIFEKNPDIFGGISGKFGIRLHAGPHYPRSEATRITCHKGFDEFIRCYPELVNFHMYSVYGLGSIDANGDPPRVNKENFSSVCKEFRNICEIQPSDWGYKNVSFAANIDEPSLVLGRKLCDFFRSRLDNAKIQLLCNFNIVSVKRSFGKLVVKGSCTEQKDGKYQKLSFDYVINATGYQSLIPVGSKELPLNLEVVYQPCLALVYEYMERPTYKLPFSFIVMDGWFPCLMPYDTRQDKNEAFSKYVMTHGKWTILGSYRTAEEAQNYLSIIDNEFIEQQVKRNCEKEMERFWPEFKTKFVYRSWIGSVLPKIKTDREFRGAVTFQNKKNRMIYIIPGKISNIFDAAEEALFLINRKKEIIEENGYFYVKEGVCFKSKNELLEKPKNLFKNTCELQPYHEVGNIPQSIAPPKHARLSLLFKTFFPKQYPLQDRANRNSMDTCILKN